MQVSSTFRTLVLSLAVAAMSLTAPGTARAQAPAQNVVEALRAAGTFGRFLQAVEQAGLTAALTAEQVTVLAPTDEAFAQIPQATLENREQLTSILRNHIIEGQRITLEQLRQQQALKTAAGKDLPVRIEGTEASIADAKVMRQIEASNGVIHVVDKVLMPE
ncbi:MAG: fasciclin domain-containing protein [Armatimonadota bacterium]|nr:fasciclin domain-containing protein [Armatimonadota bacterium]